MAGKRQIPKVQVVHEHGRVRSIRSHVAGAVEPIRPFAERSLAFAVGFWPLWAAVGLMFGLGWAMALGHSP